MLIRSPLCEMVAPQAEGRGIGVDESNRPYIDFLDPSAP
jgi:hypothetical protein